MGINDRDYMKSSGNDDDIINVNDIVFRCLKLGLVLLLTLGCLRFPGIWLKFGLALVVLVGGLKWVFFPAKKKLKAKNKNVVNKTKAPTSAPPKSSTSFNDSTLKKLTAHDAAGEFGKAKALIQSIDGNEFSEQEAEKLAAIAKNYFPVAVEQSENGYYRFKIVTVE